MWSFAHLFILFGSLKLLALNKKPRSWDFWGGWGLQFSIGISHTPFLNQPRKKLGGFFQKKLWNLTAQFFTNKLYLYPGQKLGATSFIIWRVRIRHREGRGSIQKKTFGCSPHPNIPANPYKTWSWVHILHATKASCSKRMGHLMAFFLYSLLFVGIGFEFAALKGIKFRARPKTRRLAEIVPKIGLKLGWIFGQIGFQQA